jgi:adenylylsulfate kinase
MIYWFTGQPGHGKTTLALALIQRIEETGMRAHHVDGDDLRALTLNSDYSKAGREANIRRAQTIAHFLHNKGEIVVVSLVAPYRSIREELKAAADVVECYVHTTDVRGREDRAAKDYEPPLEQFIDIDTTHRTLEECVNLVLETAPLKPAKT